MLNKKIYPKLIEQLKQGLRISLKEG